MVRAHQAWFDATESRRVLRDRWQRDAPPDESARIVGDFDFEWGRFTDVDSPSIRTVFALYFDVVDKDDLAPGRIVLDAGCGAGRWAYQVARCGPRVVAVDLGASIDVARRNTADLKNVACVQADVEDVPLGDATVDWAYSLGVLHHVIRPERAMRSIVRSVRPGGSILLYLYYALDGRGWVYRALFQTVDVIRRLISRSPRFPALIAAWLVALFIYWPLSRVAWVLWRMGLGRFATGVPLSFYAHTSFRMMVNDSLDRLGTRLERRYSKTDMLTLMTDSGVIDVRVSEHPPYWHAVGKRQR